ncbi:putative quinol monooxygenase [Agaribacterium haliotis]|uniref:putative quinol monooxygenase n=1 Tax=Agaribacterium haliotis TaxID=2013869 RepID=UPI000BB5336A|nr:antibiotic biosynthesis monooxygenase [Agaribacterium haliotis]
MPEAELNILIHARVKPSKLDAFVKLLDFLQDNTTKAGCTHYEFYQSRDCKTEFILCEHWQNQAALDAHMQELFSLLGPANPGELAPAKLMDMYESVNPVFNNKI